MLDEIQYDWMQYAFRASNSMLFQLLAGSHLADFPTTHTSSTIHPIYPPLESN